MLASLDIWVSETLGTLFYSALLIVVSFGAGAWFGRALLGWLNSKMPWSKT